MSAKLEQDATVEGGELDNITEQTRTLSLVRQDTIDNSENVENNSNENEENNDRESEESDCSLENTEEDILPYHSPEFEYDSTNIASALISEADELVQRVASILQSFGDFFEELEEDE